MLRLKTQASERFPFPKIPTFGKSSGIRSGFSYKRSSPFGNKRLFCNTAEGNPSEGKSPPPPPPPPPRKPSAYSFHSPLIGRSNDEIVVTRFLRYKERYKEWLEEAKQEAISPKTELQKQQYKLANPRFEAKLPDWMEEKLTEMDKHGPQDVTDVQVLWHKEFEDFGLYFDTIGPRTYRRWKAHPSNVHEMWEPKKWSSRRKRRRVWGWYQYYPEIKAQLMNELRAQYESPALQKWEEVHEQGYTRPYPFKLPRWRRYKWLRYNMMQHSTLSLEAAQVVTDELAKYPSLHEDEKLLGLPAYLAKFNSYASEERYQSIIEYLKSRFMRRMSNKYRHRFSTIHRIVQFLLRGRQYNETTYINALNRGDRETLAFLNKELKEQEAEARDALEKEHHFFHWMDKPLEQYRTMMLAFERRMIQQNPEILLQQLKQDPEEHHDEQQPYIVFSPTTAATAPKTQSKELQALFAQAQARLDKAIDKTKLPAFRFSEISTVGLVYAPSLWERTTEKFPEIDILLGNDQGLPDYTSHRVRPSIVNDVEIDESTCEPEELPLLDEFKDSIFQPVQVLPPLWKRNYLAVKALVPDFTAHGMVTFAIRVIPQYLDAVFSGNILALRSIVARNLWDRLTDWYEQRNQRMSVNCSEVVRFRRRPKLVKAYIIGGLPFAVVRAITVETWRTRDKRTLQRKAGNLYLRRLVQNYFWFVGQSKWHIDDADQFWTEEEKKRFAIDEEPGPNADPLSEEEEEKLKQLKINRLHMQQDVFPPKLVPPIIWRVFKVHRRGFSTKKGRHKRGRGKYGPLNRRGHYEP